MLNIMFGLTSFSLRDPQADKTFTEILLDTKIPFARHGSYE